MKYQVDPITSLATTSSSTGSPKRRQVLEISAVVEYRRIIYFMKS